MWNVAVTAAKVAPEACGALGKETIDVVLLDATIPDSERGAVITAAQAAKPAPGTKHFDRHITFDADQTKVGDGHR